MGRSLPRTGSAVPISLYPDSAYVVIGISVQRIVRVVNTHLGPRGAQYSPVDVMSKSSINLISEPAASSGVTATQGDHQLDFTQRKG